MTTLGMGSGLSVRTARPISDPTLLYSTLFDLMFVILFYKPYLLSYYLNQSIILCVYVLIYIKQIIINQIIIVNIKHTSINKCLN